MTNRNFRCASAATMCVVRLPGKDTELLGIDREAERAATAAAATAGVGPEVIAFLTVPPCLVTRVPPRPPAHRGGAAEPPMLAQLAAALRAFHAGPPLPSRFDAFAIVDAYAATARGARRARRRTRSPTLMAGARGDPARRCTAPSTRRSRATTTC